MPETLPAAPPEEPDVEPERLPHRAPAPEPRRKLDPFNPDWPDTWPLPEPKAWVRA
jgi:hypothetical protein